MRRFAALALLIVMLVASVASAEPIIKNTKKTQSHVSVFTVPVWFVPKKGFTFERISGSCCADRKKKISIEASELRVPYARLLDEFSNEKLKEAGVALKMRSVYVWNGSNAVLMKVFQRKGKSVMGKWLLIVDRGDSSWMISGLYNAKDVSHAKAVLSMMETIFWENVGDESARYVAPLGNVDTGSTPFKLAGIRQDAFVYTKDGAIPTKSPDGALFVLSRLIDTQIMTDGEGPMNFAKRHLKGIVPDSELEIVSEIEVMVDSMPGVEIIAYTQSEPKKLVFQTILFDSMSNHVMVGIAREDSSDALEMFHRLVAGYSRGWEH